MQTKGFKKNMQLFQLLQKCFFGVKKENQAEI